MDSLNESGKLIQWGDHDYGSRGELPSEPTKEETPILVENIASNVTVSTDIGQSENISWNEGRRVVELEVLAEQLFCNKCNTPLHLKDIVGEMRHDKKYRLYSPTALTNAYISVKNNEMSQRKAALQFNVPRQTLRDRITGKISPDCVTTGRAPVFSLEEEARIVEHVKSMASYGYGYTRQEVTDLATDFAHTIKIKPRSEEFTLRWFEGFIKRWPELRVVKPRSLEILRAKCGSVANVEKYFASLTEVVLKYNLQDKPHLIFNVDEKGITLNHKPPNVVSGIECTTSSVTSGRSSTTTILGCGSASGFAVPPYFVFEGKRLNNELMKGATPGAVGAVSDSGWSNTNIFRQYLTDHFLKYIPGRNNDNVLLLLDGHKSHVAVDIIEWAQEHHIIIHVLPAHTSHILQPLDVGCYGPLQRIYDNECHKTIRKNSSVITKYNICELACKAYQKALCPENLQSAFRKTGIYPLDKTVINQDQLKPSEVFTRNEECKETTETTDEPKTDEIQMQEVELVEVDMNREVTEAVESAVTVTDVVEDMQDHDTDVPHFFAERINKLKK
ncbi:unnamed protein product [Mytilus edulis]|uniref:DDE-1 domain-containing protein n=1 Tax=Mytilus edulis TaxID=6550 RepID=A0A8S3Q2A7_MYTED|nr:unnamed protein product [Mytilus edulis]